jgi:hypothetical protein
LNTINEFQKENEKMIKKRFILPWFRRQVVVCPKCSGTIEMFPLVPGEETKDRTLLEHTICHKIDPELLAKLPRLSEADCASRQISLSYRAERHKLTGENKTDREFTELLARDSVFPAYFNKHGIFVLLDILSATTLEALLLLFAEEENAVVNSGWLRTTMRLSAASVSGIVKELKRWSLLIYGPWPEAKGRAKGRLTLYIIHPSARKVLNGDLQNHAFFRSFVMDIAGPVVEKYPQYRWRKDLFGTNN